MDVLLALKQSNESLNENIANKLNSFMEYIL